MNIPTSEMRKPSPCAARGGGVRAESDTVISGVRKRSTLMKFASFENVLTVATLVMFAVFLVWSVKIIAAWA